LKVVLEIAIRVNQVLDRIKNFETSINELGDKLNRRDILGNDVLNTIQNQINGISKKGKIADKFLQMSDGKLNDLYEQQTKVLTEMNKRYQVAIEGHISGFEEMIKTQTEELEARHQQFLQTLEVKFNIEDIRAEFSNLKKLNEILSQLQSIANDGVKSSELKGKLQSIQDELGKIESATLKIQPAERKGWFNR
jgi:hypothetical protein